jgi:SAM-dependent methyltransferase
MTPASGTSPYDAFAWFYDRYWAPPFHDWQTPVLERLLFPALQRGDTILDLCCGTGHLANRLVTRGYQVIGVDASLEMLRFARTNVPAAEFVHADAAQFALARTVDAAVSTFDSLNHILNAEQVQRAFGRIHAVLRSGGLFVFDINTPEAYGERWNHSACQVYPEGAFFLRGGFDPQAGAATTSITMFRLLGETWQRSDVEVQQRPWDVQEIENMLQAAGFRHIDRFRTNEDRLGTSGHYGIGRVHFRAVK